MVKKFFRVALFPLMFICAFPSLGWSRIRIELAVFGNMNLNLGFPKEVTTDPAYASEFRSYYPEWQPFYFDPILQQKTGMGFGGRLAVEIHPRLAVEASIESSASEFRFDREALDAVKAKLEATGYLPYNRFKDSGGRLTRGYMNVVFNLRTEGTIIPFVLAGIGVTKFTMGPSNSGNRADYA